MNDIDVCNEALQEFIDSVVSAARKVFEEPCDTFIESIEYFSKNLCNSEPWMYIQSWFDACIKNPKSLHYMRRSKKRRIRKKHTDYLAKQAFKIYEERRNQP